MLLEYEYNMSSLIFVPLYHFCRELSPFHFCWGSLKTWIDKQLHLYSPEDGLVVTILWQLQLSWHNLLVLFSNLNNYPAYTLSFIYIFSYLNSNSTRLYFDPILHQSEYEISLPSHTCIIMYTYMYIHVCFSQQTRLGYYTTQWRSFMVYTGILSNNMQFPCHEC